MPSQRENGIGTAWMVILVVMLTIILRAALENFFPPLISGHTVRQVYEAGWPSPDTNLRVCQFVLFLVLLGRYYWGAYRFNEEQPPVLPVAVIILNMVGTFGLFAFFYIISVNLWTTDLFYLFILLMHGFDFCWFFLALQKLQEGSPLLEPIKKFMLWDGLTFVAYIVFSVWLWNGFWNGTDLWLQRCLLLSLFVISVIDWWVLRDFYLRRGRWAQARAQPPPPTSLQA